MDASFLKNQSYSFPHLFPTIPQLGPISAFLASNAAKNDELTITRALRKEHNHFRASIPILSRVVHHE